MTAVSPIMSETAFDLERAKCSSVRWTERGTLLEIISQDRELLEMARGVFPARSPAASGTAARCWRVERAREGADGWLVSGSSDTSSMIPALAETREIALLYVEQDAIDWLLNTTTDSIVVHAALVSKDGKGVAIVGPSFAGKSTLATALWRKGWSLMSDDLVFIDTHARSAWPVPRRVSLRFESRELVGESLWTDIRSTASCIETTKGLFFHPHEVAGDEKQKLTPLSAIFFLARREATLGAAEIRAMNSAKASLSLLPYSFNARRLPFVDGLRSITPLFETVRAFDLGRGELDSMVTAVENEVG